MGSVMEVEEGARSAEMGVKLVESWDQNVARMDIHIMFRK